MGYRSLAQCVAALEATGRLRRVDIEVDPWLELGCIQRRAFRAKAPALLFTRVRGTPYPMLANLFGTHERMQFLFQDTYRAVERLFRLVADPAQFLRQWKTELPACLGLLPHALNMRPEFVPPHQAAVLACRAPLTALPKLVGWPLDGGPFITLPLVYSEDPDRPGHGHANLGMYRIQLGGNDYGADEVGLHYQIHRGIGVHHAHALARGEKLPVQIFVGGPPALTLAAVMPLPEGLSELRFAGLLGGQRVRMTRANPLPVLADADFCITGLVEGSKPEGPFGDHVGYYSLQHPFPVVRVTSVRHRKDAIWPFTSVGRPPQEDTVFGDTIHELTGPLIPRVFQGIREIHAVDAAGVHPLLLALASERYTPYEARRQPRELLTCAMHLLGTSQTALAKYVLVAAQEDAPGLGARDVAEFLAHLLERTDFARDLHFLTASTNDTLDYTGGSLHQGSKLVWASCGEKRRELATELDGLDGFALPDGFVQPHVAGKGLLVIQGPQHNLSQGQQDGRMIALTQALEHWTQREAFPLVVVADDSAFCADSLQNFLWVTFTRTDPATDSYGAFAATQAKHWSCQAPLVLDARVKPFHAPTLEEDPDVVRRVESLAAPGGPLHGLY